MLGDPRQASDWSRFAYSYDAYRAYFPTGDAMNRLIEEVRRGAAEGALDLKGYGADSLRALLFYGQRYAHWVDSWKLFDEFIASEVVEELRGRIRGPLPITAAWDEPSERRDARLLAHVDAFARRLEGGSASVLARGRLAIAVELDRGDVVKEITVYVQWLVHLLRQVADSPSRRDQRWVASVRRHLEAPVGDLFAVWSVVVNVDVEANRKLFERAKRLAADLGWETLLASVPDEWLDGIRRRWAQVRSGANPASTQFQIVWTPPFTGQLPDAHGRWFYVTGQGYYWTDDDHLVGVLEVGESSAVKDLNQLKVSVEHEGGTATDAFDAARRRAESSVGPVDVVSGALGDLPDLVELARGQLRDTLEVQPAWRLAMGDTGPWTRELRTAWRAAANPTLDERLPALPGEPGLVDRVAYWSPLLHLLVYGLGWQRPDFGLAAWRQAGFPVDDPILNVVSRWWGHDGVADVLSWCVERGGVAVNLRAISGTHPDLADGPPERRVPDDRALAERRASSAWRVTWSGGYDPLHLVSHLGAPLVVTDSQRSIVLVDGTDVPSDEGSVLPRLFLSTPTYEGWYANLLRRDGSRAANGRSVRANVIVEPVGWMGTFRRHEKTGLWFRGRSAIHLWGQ
ncbi:hypothetical protein CLV34_2137 [Luteimicrobium subarcticum]|uniref:Uncharacterized protein n=2 Tax=Luteimicrobium subarcticum TaxID=620910 RepID=A0A2M8WRK0_9MICO|nr:hypothetical protein CLV34_2137 [Luteimicrobium subarcticum]